MHSVKTPPRDIVATAVEAGSLTAFSSALTAAGLLGRLRGEGPFTVFAPTDAAFALIAEHTLHSWLRSEGRARLTNLMTYHLLQGRLPAARIIESSSVRTEQGTSLTIRFANGRMHVNNATVVRPDVECSNGLIHVIDTVMIPR